MSKTAKNTDEPVQMTCEVQRDVHDRLAVVKRRRGVTDAEIIDQALREHLFPEFRRDRDARIRTDLDRLLRAVCDSQVALSNTREVLSDIREGTLNLYREEVAVFELEERDELFEWDMKRIRSRDYPDASEVEEEDLLGL